MSDDNSSPPEPLTEAPEGGFSAKTKAIAMTPKVTGCISILCSAYLICYICTSTRRRNLTYQRLIAVLCICDIVSSFGIALSTWPLPVGNNFGALYEGEPDGTNPLCTAQGVFVHWGLTTALTNVALSMHYLLVVKFSFTEQRMKRIEPYYMASILFLGLVCISIPLSQGIYGYNPYSRNMWCFIFVPPKYCDDEADCIHRTIGLRWALFFGPLWFCILLCMILMIALYCIVRKIESAALRWRSSVLAASFSAPTMWPTDQSCRSDTLTHLKQQQPKDFRQTKKVARQAILYVLSFLIVWLPLLVLNTINLIRKTWFNPEQPDGFVALWAVMLFQPLQGFWNLIIYRKFGVIKVMTSIPRRVSSFISSQVNRSHSPSYHSRQNKRQQPESPSALFAPLPLPSQQNFTRVADLHHEAVVDDLSSIFDHNGDASHHDGDDMSCTKSSSCNEANGATRESSSGNKECNKGQEEPRRIPKSRYGIEDYDDKEPNKQNVRFSSKDLVHEDANDDIPVECVSETWQRPDQLHCKNVDGDEEENQIRQAITFSTMHREYLSSTTSYVELEENLVGIYGDVIKTQGSEGWKQILSCWKSEAMDDGVQPSYLNENG